MGGRIRTFQWEPSIKGEWVDLPPYKLPDKDLCYNCNGVGSINICPECCGNGYVDLETDYNTYECECKMCETKGEVPGEDNICKICDGDG